MDATIVLFLTQDGIVNGAIYALLAIALVLVFAVTRVIFVPQGEFVAFGALTLAALEQGLVPGTAALLVCLGLAAAALDLWRERAGLTAGLVGLALRDVALPLALYALARWLAPLKPGLLVDVPLSLALVAPMGPLVYRLAFQPMAEASVLVLLIAAVGVHLALTGLGLYFFGPEGFRTQAFSDASFQWAGLTVTGQSLWMIGLTLALLAALWLFFERSLMGKALRAVAVNRDGARLSGIPAAQSGQVAFGMAAFIGALSGVLIAPVTTISYDTGFLIGLKGFVAAILGGLGSYPLAAAMAVATGLLEAFASFWASAFKEVIVFSAIVPFLLWRSFARPHGGDEE